MSRNILSNEYSIRSSLSLSLDLSHCHNNAILLQSKYGEKQSHTLTSRTRVFVYICLSLSLTLALLVCGCAFEVSCGLVTRLSRFDTNKDK